MPIKEVRTQYNQKEMENRIRQFWEKNGIPHKITTFDPKKKKFYFLDGPPYVNQMAHVGHVKTTTIKDIWSKFKFMQGFSTWFQPGFDCHGLPIENMVEKELGITSKKQIEGMGVDKFIAACKSKAEGTEQGWLKLYRTLGGWRGYVDPYLTFKNYYIESGWWTTKQLFEKGMLTRGEKTVFWCPHCETALSGYEVTDSYAEVKDPSIYVKFPVRGKQNEYFLIWTTTPWTLISNVAIAVHPDEYYVKVKVGNDILIMAEKRVEPVLKELLKLNYEIQEKFLGKELEGMKFDPVFDVPVQQKMKSHPNAHKIILSMPVMKSKSYKHEKGKATKEEFKEFVTMEEGSGLVHTAPGHGPEDHLVGLHYNLPVASPLDDEGKFTSDGGEFKGQFVKDADKPIVEKLEKKGFLLHFNWVQHTYPLCWRCKSPLIFRMSKQWFFKIDTIKDRMIKENKKVKWLPEFGQERFHNWLDQAVDWNISQQRYWGIPLPIWVCSKCETIETIGSIEELRRKAISKLPKEIELHKHIVDKIELKCKSCGGVMKRIPDTMNVWFDSGIATWASLGYPFQNKELFEKLWPADLICESQDQIRGWFYSLMFCGVSTFNQSPYKSVAMLGWVLDEKGEKMSKSQGNVVWADEGLEKLGADIIRLYYCWEVPPWEVQNFSFKTAEEIRRMINILWNSYAFFTTYVTEDFKPKLKYLRVEDRWVLSKVNSLISETTNHLENFEFHHAGRKLVNFVVNDLSRFYIKLIRDRVWVSEKGEDKTAALSVLYYVLTTLSKLLAPIAPFVSEDIFQNLVCNVERKCEKSVHLTGWPKADKELIDKELEEAAEIGKKIIDCSYSARESAELKLRWPIGELLILSSEKGVVETVKSFNKVFLQLCNCKVVKIIKEKPKGDYLEVDFDFGKIFINKKLDEKLMEEAMLRELIREIQSLRKKNGFSVKDSIQLSLNSDEKTNESLKIFEKVLSKEVGAKKVSVGKLSGKFKGGLEFDNKRVEIQFS